MADDSKNGTASTAEDASQVSINHKTSPQYKLLFEEAVVPIILTDLNGYIIDSNIKACDFLGYSRSALIDVPLNDINIASLHLLDLNDLKLDEERTFRNVAYDLDGNEIPTLVRARRIVIDDKERVEWVLQDMTAQVELERLRHDLSAMVYHDLRGPLQNIVASMSRLTDMLDDHENKAVNRLLELGMRSSRQLQRMIDSLLDIQRLEEGKNILNRKPALVTSIVAEAVDVIKPIANETGQTVQVDIAPNLPVVSADTDMIMRVAVNLLENATKYSPSDGDITISARLDVNGRDILFVVADSGPGIPEDMKTSIFDKFSRVSYKNAPRGVGLGLAFCKLAVSAHGGRIWVESEPGNGSKFCFSLPPMYPDRTFNDRETQPLPPMSSLLLDELEDEDVPASNNGVVDDVAEGSDATDDTSDTADATDDAKDTGASEPPDTAELKPDDDDPAPDTVASGA